MHETRCPVASIVPGPAISNAGNGEEIGSDPFVLYASWRLHLLKKSRRGLVSGIRHGFDCKISAMIPRKESVAFYFIRWARIFCEDRHRNINAEPRVCYGKGLPPGVRSRSTRDRQDESDNRGGVPS
jgi:hypothetical protein